MNFSENKVFFVRYTLRTSDGRIVDQMDDTTNLYGSWSEANREMKAHLDAFNAGCTRGIWRGQIHALNKQAW